MPPRMPTSRCGCGSVLKPRLPAEHMTTVYETLERPMVDVLARMERRGITIDRADPLAALGRVRAGHGAARGTRSTSWPARRFNLGSPKAARRYSVRQDGPARRARRPRPAPGPRRRACSTISPSKATTFAARILDWRQLSKLKSTYTDALPAYVDPHDRPRAHLLRARRDHHRAAVVVRAQPAEHPGAHRGGAKNPHAPSSPRQGHKLISADYSQIELRLLAHIADIPQLKAGLRRRASTFTP